MPCHIDVLGAITGSSVPKRYWSDLKKKLKSEGFEAYDNIVRLKLLSPDGKKRDTDCSDTETVLRVKIEPSKETSYPARVWRTKVLKEQAEKEVEKMLRAL